MPSGCGTAVVVMSARLEPACGSVRAMVPKKRPVSRWVRYLCCCAGVPKRRMTLALPWVRPTYEVVAMLALLNSEPQACEIKEGSCMPPTSASWLAASRPASQ